MRHTEIHVFVHKVNKIKLGFYLLKLTLNKNSSVSKESTAVLGFVAAPALLTWNQVFDNCSKICNV